jgi:hypothetical protein
LLAFIILGIRGISNYEGRYIMKKLLLAVVIFILMTGTALTFPGEPLGWLGWAWETPLNDLAGWLSYNSTLESDDETVTIDIFTRQGETKTHLQMEWDLVGYGFIESNFEGIILVGNGTVNAVAALAALLKEYGKPDRQITFENSSLIEFWQGTYGSVFAFYSPAEEEMEAMTWVAIGTKKIMDATALIILGMPLTMEQLFK